MIDEVLLSKSVSASRIDRLKLGRVGKDQIKMIVFGDGSRAKVFFLAKPKKVRTVNSHERAAVRLDDGLSYCKWCENCGEKFETVNKSRGLCDACHEEICETLKVDYSQMALNPKNQNEEEE